MCSPSPFVLWIYGVISGTLAVLTFAKSLDLRISCRDKTRNGLRKQQNRPTAHYPDKWTQKRYECIFSRRETRDQSAKIPRVFIKMFVRLTLANWKSSTTHYHGDPEQETHCGKNDQKWLGSEQGHLFSKLNSDYLFESPAWQMTGWKLTNALKNTRWEWHAEKQSTDKLPSRVLPLQLT